MAVPSGGRAIQASALSHTIFREFHKIFSLGLRPLSHTLDFGNFFARVVGAGEWGWQPKTTSPKRMRRPGAGRRPVLRVSTIAEALIALALVALAMIADSMVDCAMVAGTIVGRPMSRTRVCACAWVCATSWRTHTTSKPSPTLENHSPKRHSRANKSLHGARSMCIMVSVGSRQSRRAT